MDLAVAGSRLLGKGFDSEKPEHESAHCALGVTEDLCDSEKDINCDCSGQTRVVWIVQTPSTEELSKQLHCPPAASITVLVITNAHLSSIPFDISLLPNLSQVDLSKNQLEDLPNEFENLKKITYLNLSHNSFVNPPQCLLIGLNFIRHLDLSNNHMTQFDSVPLCMSYLNSLNLSYNCLDRPPVWLCFEIPYTLQTIDLSFNPCFKFLPLVYSNIMPCAKITRSVKHLNISNTGFSDYNMPFLQDLVSIVSLNIGNQGTYSKGQSINFFSKDLEDDFLWSLPLEELEIKHAGLASMSSNIYKSEKLRKLDISGNNLKWLHDNLTLLSKLVVLKVASAGLVMLPTDIGLLRSLKELHLAHNDLSSMPESAKHLVKLEALDLFDNSFTACLDLEPFVDLKGFDISMNYLQDQSHDKFNLDSLRNYFRSNWNHEDRTDGNKVMEESKFDTEQRYEKDFDDDFEEERYSSTPSPDRSEQRNDTNNFEEEIWNQENEDEEFNPEVMAWNGICYYSSDEEINRLRRYFRNTDHYFCPFQLVSSFRSCRRQVSSEEEEGQFADA